VVRETLRLTPPHQQQLYTEAVQVELQDLGSSYQLGIVAPTLQTEKTYVDPGRDCTRRARFAAVFVVLTLMPPEVAAEADADSSESARAAPESLARPRASMDAAALLSWSPPVFDGPELVAPGVLLRGSAYVGAWGANVAATYHQKTEFDLESAAMQSRRWSVAVGLELARHGARWTFVGEAGTVARFQRLRATELLAPETRSAFELGVRIGARAVFSLGRFGLVAGVLLDGFPAPTELTVAPRGRLGTTAAIDINSYVGGRIGF
jgi:hypothetical protein